MIAYFVVFVLFERRDKWKNKFKREENKFINLYNIHI